MEAKEIRNLNADQLEQELEEARAELFTLRFQQATSGLPNTNRIPYVKRQIARLLTVRQERRLWAEYEARAASPGNKGA